MSIARPKEPLWSSSYRERATTTHSSKKNAQLIANENASVFMSQHISTYAHVSHQFQSSSPNSKHVRRIHGSFISDESTVSYTVLNLCVYVLGIQTFMSSFQRGPQNKYVFALNLSVQKDKIMIIFGHQFKIAQMVNSLGE